VSSLRTRLEAIAKSRFYAQDKYSTHAPILNASINFLHEHRIPNQRLVMLEIGTGGSSSKILQNAILKTPNSTLVSFENDYKWAKLYEEKYRPQHNWELIKKPDENWPTLLQRLLNRLHENDLLLSFIDSSPWESRTSSFEILKNRSNIVLVHDIDYFAVRGLIGTQISEIRYKPKSYFRYGKLESRNLGIRDYSQSLKYWRECFPVKPGYFTGPPTLIGSNIIDVRNVPIGKEIIKLPGG
jgi:hypothetical protein